MDKLLVVGIDTIIGANAALALSAQQDVLGIGSQQRLVLEGVATQHVRQGDLAALVRAADELRPDWILYCGPLSASSWDLPAADPAWQREPARVEAVLECARSLSARLTVVLTDGVFSGPRMFHDESSPAESPRAAGAAALAIEQLLANTAALVVRTHAYGWAPAGVEPETVERIWQSLAAGSLPELDGRRYATPILATDLAELLDRARQLNLQGLMHLTGAERTNPFRLASEMAAACGLPTPRNRMTFVDCEPVRVDQIDETSLTSRRARRSLGVPMPMLREGLQRFAAQERDGWRNRSRLLEHAGPRDQAA